MVLTIYLPVLPPLTLMKPLTDERMRMLFTDGRMPNGVVIVTGAMPLRLFVVILFLFLHQVFRL